MAKEQRNMSGVIFRNNRKEKETHPDRTGSCTIDGRQYWISGWIKHHDQQGDYLSLEFKLKDQQPASPPAERPAAGAYKSGSGRPMDNFADDIPFR